MEKEQSNEIILRTYGSVWKIDRKIYSIDGLRLPFPFVINEFVYLGISIIITFILIKILPFLNNFNFIIKWLVMPFGIMKALTTIKLDGKAAHKFIYDYILFMCSPRQYARFKPIKKNKKKIHFDYRVLFRNQIVVNKTDLVIDDRRR